MTRQCLHRRRIDDVDELRTRTVAWSTDVNTRRRGEGWRMKIDDARCNPKTV